MVETFNVEKKTHKSITNIETQILASLKNINEITLNEIADSVLKKIITECVNDKYIEVIYPKKNILSAFLSIFGLQNDEKKYRLTPFGLEHLDKKMME